MSNSNLKLGNGYAWAGHFNATVVPISRLKVSDLSSVKNLGRLLPIGSVRERKRRYEFMIGSNNSNLPSCEDGRNMHIQSSFIDCVKKMMENICDQGSTNLYRQLKLYHIGNLNNIEFHGWNNNSYTCMIQNKFG